MKLSELHIENFKSIEETRIESIDELSVFVGKNDAGKSAVLEAVRMFLLEKGKPEINQFHMGNEDDIVVSGIFTDITSDLTDNLCDSVNASDGELKITRRWEYPDPRRSMADTFLGQVEEQLSSSTLVNEYESLGKKDTREFLWSHLPKPIYVPAERDISEEAKFKSNTLIERLLTPLIEEDDSIRDTRLQLENELNDGVGDIENSIEGRLVEHVDSVSNLELDTGEIELGKAFSPSIRVTDEFSDMSVPIGQRGSGVGSMLVLSLVETLRERQVGEGYLMLFEEPGNWLHPEAKRRMLTALKQISRRGGQVMLSTHSPVFIDRRGHGDVFLVKRKEGKTSVRKIEENHLSIVEELGARNSDILQSDFVLYVEGSTDVQMLDVIADNYLPKEVRARVTIQHLGGTGNIRQCDLGDLAEINQTFGFLLDSDRDGPDDTEKEYIADLRTEVEEVGADVLLNVLEYREIENYFTSEAINDALNLDVDPDFVTGYDDIPDKLSAELKRHHADEEVATQEKRTCDHCGHIRERGKAYQKVKGRSIVESMYDYGQNIEEIENFLDKIIQTIE